MYDRAGKVTPSGCDRQIKIRGVRIDPCEIETALLTPRKICADSCSAELRLAGPPTRH
jgi:hypothetical protein